MTMLDHVLNSMRAVFFIYFSCVLGTIATEIGLLTNLSNIVMSTYCLKKGDAGIELTLLLYVLCVVLNSVFVVLNLSTA